MAGANLEVTLVGADEFQRAIERAEQHLVGSERRLMLQDIGEYLLNATRERAGKEVGPDGRPWQPLSPRYAERKARKRSGRKLLIFDRHLLGDQLSTQLVGDDAVAVGTNAVYGAAHQFGVGRRGLPARPWLGISDEDDAEMAAIAEDHLGRIFAVRGT